MWLGRWLSVCLIPLAGWILVSGLDDLFIGLVFIFARRRRLSAPADADLESAPERRIAILVPLWREHRVIQQMLQRNIGAIRYRNYEVFVGVYPNDQLTLRAVAEAARSLGRVHLAVCPHDGPTSKGDCLNSVHQRMVDYEALHGIRFDIIMTHDAEDLVHADSLRLINWYSRDYQMVQMPVLPLPTGLGELTHGLYCDEFAEFQQKDIPVRQRLGGFLPANGVGTGFDRDSLDRLAARGRLFDPESLTEDYETGFRLHAMGCRQIFVPLRIPAAGPVATREYFPRNFRAAVRQRSRWVAGIALQGWQRHGWRGQAYWWWRDRKGLVGNLLAPLANLFVLGFVASSLAIHVPAWVSHICTATLCLSLSQAALRGYCGARIYGARFVAALPLRMLWGNVVNCVATLSALSQFVQARLRRRSLAWRKTDHVYPAHAGARRDARLGELLVRMRCLSISDVREALLTRPPGLRLGEHLVQVQKISRQHLYRALSYQSGIPLGLAHDEEVDCRATRALPAETVRRWKVLPYRVDLGQLHVATADLPTPEMTGELARLSALEIRFRLVQPEELEAMTAQYLPADS